MKPDKTKILSIMVVILVLINITTLASIWPHIDLKTFSFAPPGPMSPKEFIINKLNLDEEQQKVFEELRKEHFEEMRNLQARIIDEKDAMYDLLKTNTPDTLATFSHIAAIMQHEERLERITFEHFRKVRAICNDEQKQHFDVIIDKVMHMVMRPAPGQKAERNVPAGPLP